MYHSDYEAWLRHHERIEKMTVDVRRYRLAKLARAARRLKGAAAGSNTMRSVPAPRPVPADQTDGPNWTDRIDQTEVAKPAAMSSGSEPSQGEPNPSARQPVGCAR